MTRGRVPRHVIVALGLVLASCSGGVGPGSESLGGGSTSRDAGSPSGPTADPGPSPTFTAGREPSPSTDPPDGGTTDDVAAGAAAFAFVPWGPDDPPVPQRYSALAALGAGTPQCDDAAANALPGPFWELAVEVCRAAAGQGPWPSATTVPAPPPAQNAYEACLDDELAATLRRALAARTASATPQVHYATSGTLSPCQTTVFEARALTAAEGYGNDVVPVGHVAVLVMAGSADVTSTVTVDGVPADVLGVEPASGAATLVVVVPAPPAATTASVAVTTTRGVLTTTVALPAAPPDATGEAGPTGATP